MERAGGGSRAGRADEISCSLSGAGRSHDSGPRLRLRTFLAAPGTRQSAGRTVADDRPPFPGQIVRTHHRQRPIVVAAPSRAFGRATRARPNWNSAPSQWFLSFNGGINNGSNIFPSKTRHRPGHAGLSTANSRAAGAARLVRSRTAARRSPSPWKKPAPRSIRATAAIAATCAGPKARKPRAAPPSGARRQIPRRRLSQTRKHQGDGGEDARKQTAKGHRAAVARSRKADGHTRGELYAKAKSRRIEGRSRMSKRQLENALGIR